MDWLSKHKVLIDCAKKSVKLTTPNGKEWEFVAEPVMTAKGVVNHAKVNPWMLVKDLRYQWSMSFPMSSPRNCQVCRLTETSSLRLS
jgi:hypothetical protein